MQLGTTSSGTSPSRITQKRRPAGTVASASSSGTAKSDSSSSSSSPSSSSTISAINNMIYGSNKTASGFATSSNSSTSTSVSAAAASSSNSSNSNGSGFGSSNVSSTSSTSSSSSSFEPTTVAELTQAFSSSQLLPTPAEVLVESTSGTVSEQYDAASRRQDDGAAASSSSPSSVQPAYRSRSGAKAKAPADGPEKVVMPFMAAPSKYRLPSLAAPITWTLMISYILVMLLVPISALLWKAYQIPFHIFVERAFEPVAMHAYEVTFTMAAAAAAINSVFGFLLAWVLVKYKFPGKKWIDAAVDLPFALPTSVAGLTLSTVYGDEALLGVLLAKLGIRVVFTKLGVAVAMVFVSFPFVVRTMQPVLQELEKETEEAAWTLGASEWRTFTDVVLPPLLPSLLTGTALAFSRALGEFGSIAIIASNFAFKDLIAPVLIFQALEQYDFVGATVVGTVLLLASLAIMLVVNKLQSIGNNFRK